MCIVSAVMDHYQPLIPRPDDFAKRLQDLTTQAPSVFQPLATKADLDAAVAEIKSLIAEFKDAVAAATKLDALLKQPDCVDPEKQKLVERVKELEAQLAQIARVVERNPKKQKGKRA